MNSPIRDYISKFYKSIESGDSIIIPFSTLIFDYKFNFVFANNTYYFSLTGHDLLEMVDHDRQAIILKLCKDIYTSKTVAHALLTQIEYYLDNKANLEYHSLTAFDKIKAEGYVGKWVLEQIRKIEGYGMIDQYRAMVGRLIESKVPA